MDETELIFENLKTTADVVVETFGRNCEVAIHNFRNLRKSLIYINGNLTKRQPGAPITDLVLKALRRYGNAVENLCNYRTNSKNGRVIKASTSFIRNSAGEVIGAFCINFDITDYLNSVSMLGDLIKVKEKKGSAEITETFASSPQETISSLIEQGVELIGKQPATMNTEERLELVGILEGKGAFLIKGAVDLVAAVMGISKYTVYNYLKKIRLQQELKIT